MSIDQYQTLTTNTGSMRGPDTANARNQGFVGEAFVVNDSNGNKKTPYSFAYEGGKYTLEIDTQGDTSTPSVVKIKAKRHDGSAINLATHHLRVRACAEGAFGTHGSATIAAGTGSTLIETLVPGNDPGTVATGVVTDDDSATSNGTDVVVAINEDGITGYLESTTANDADAVFAIGQGGPVVNINDNDSPASVVLYFDEDATNADERFLIISPTGKDVFIPTSSGQYLRLKHDASAASNGVACHFDDDATNNWERLLFVSPTNADGEFTTDDLVSAQVGLEAGKDIVVSNVAAVAASGTLTISGVVSDGETVVIGGLDNTRTYYFSTGLSSVPSGNVSVDISANGTKAQGTMTIAEPVTVGDTFAVGSRTYVFVTAGTENIEGEISVGADEAATKVNIVAAINGTDGINSANPEVTAAAFAGDDCVMTARHPGIWANSIPFTEIVLTHASNVLDGSGTFGGTTTGVECSASDAGDALVTALAGDSLAEVSGVNASGTVTVTAVATGSSYNAVTTTETMTNGAFGAGTLASGVTGNLDEFIVNLTNATVGTTTLRIGAPPVGQNAYMVYDATLDVAHAAP